MVGVNLRKYPTFCPKIWHLVSRSFPRSLLNEISRGAYRAEIPRSLIELIRIQTERISEEDISKIVSAITTEIEHVAVSFAKEYDKAFSLAIDETTRAIQRGLVFPLVSNLEKPLQNLELGDENRVFLTQDELTNVLTELLTNKISELIRLTIGKQQPDVDKELRAAFELNEVKSRVLSFFESLKVGDLFLELYEMQRNQKILDKQELYLYFCDISYENAKYPIFYVPFALTHRDDALVMEFDAQVYINKRAIEFVVQEVNRKEDRRGTLRSSSERIIYLAQHETDFPSVISAVLQELINVLQLDGTIDIGNPSHQVARSQAVRVSNDCSFAPFDKSDEALVNDYEEILRLLTLGKDNPLAFAFQKLIDDFIHRNPESFTLKVEDEWDESTPSEKLVFNSPVPLNSEQRQILAALNKDGCRYVTVEGPPGTGKSHTITAVVFDAIQKDQSVLVLSDKKEALDVVEDKITDTMNRVRFDKNFQNPILRLGRTGSTYSEILSTSSIDNIKTHHRAVKKEYEKVEDDITRTANTLKDDIEAEIVSYWDVDLAEIRELIEVELESARTIPPVELDEFLSQTDGATHFDDIRNACIRLVEVFRPAKAEMPEMAKALRILGWGNTSAPSSGNEVFDRAERVSDILGKLQAFSEKNTKAVGLFPSFSSAQLRTLGNLIHTYEDCRSSLFGYLFKSRKVADNDSRAQQIFRLRSTEKPHAILSELKDAYSILSSINVLIGEEVTDRGDGFDTLSAIHQFLIQPSLRPSLNLLNVLRDECSYLTRNVFPLYPKSIERIGIREQSVISWLDCSLNKLSQTECDKLIRHLSLNQKLHRTFADVHPVNYGQQQSSLQDLATVQMTHLLDGRVIEFYENNKATAKTLRDIIRTKRQFPKEEFGKLKKAFPCILAGIRDYAEYIPLEAELFDLLIIDEASQVSVSQAFPALLRAKRVLILGDRKQFSNVKAAQARGDTNREYVNQLREVVIANISKEQEKLVRLEKFNIKSSILDFFELITNYQIQLSKYFRGYKEIISFSNTNFYRNSLQVMKIRGKAIDDVLKFTFLDDDGKQTLVSKTNTTEVDFIISELRRLKERNSSASIGIITPHTNQQKLLIETIERMPERNYLFEALKLKIMTFDTCQGEERDLIYYSMVATRSDDRLWGVFIKDLKNVQIEEEGQIKAQRLNVGLSRAKECMHFVLSKGLDEYNGSIGEALRHYAYIRDEAKRERSVSEVDQNSAMEPAVLNWLYQTGFWLIFKDNVELIPQFELGKYLKQLDKTYEHPLYRVDFLLIFREEGAPDRNLILEYDGFVEHFVDLPGIDESNYASYYSEEHVYRQKVLEGYGYRFLRLNRFNVGDNPVQTLDSQLWELLLGEETKRNQSIESIHSAIEGLQNGDLKECPKCKQLRPLGDFRNKTLSSGMSRFCAACKSRVTHPHSIPSEHSALPKATAQIAVKTCPLCGSRMLMKSGRYGKFLGCSKYPYCKATLKA